MIRETIAREQYYIIENVMLHLRHTLRKLLLNHKKYSLNETLFLRKLMLWRDEESKNQKNPKMSPSQDDNVKSFKPDDELKISLIFSKK